MKMSLAVVPESEVCDTPATLSSTMRIILSTQSGLNTPPVSAQIFVRTVSSIQGTTQNISIPPDIAFVTAFARAYVARFLYDQALELIVGRRNIVLFEIVLGVEERAYYEDGKYTYDYHPTKACLDLGRLYGATFVKADEV